jgi:hypothetical protein
MATLIQAMVVSPALRSSQWWVAVEGLGQFSVVYTHDYNVEYLLHIVVQVHEEA